MGRGRGLRRQSFGIRKMTAPLDLTKRCRACETEVRVETDKCECGSTSFKPERTRTSGTYKSWRSMIVRASSDNPHYGARGILVCEKWKRFRGFFEDMGVKPTGLTIERIDVNGHYEPGNCRWATWTEQALNKTNTTLIEFRGERLTLTQWAKRTGLTRPAIFTRYRYGWDVERMLTQPKRKSPTTKMSER
jgi:hypothetical protein